jgi:polyhydroxybutyrate depolymerase
MSIVTRARLLTVTLIALSAAVSGCGGTTGSSPSAAPHAPLVTHGALAVSGQQRTYRLYRPASVDPHAPAPLVVVLHGNASTADDMVQTTQFDLAADAHGFVLVYPNGVERSWNGGFCCEPAPTLQVDDVAFLNALLQHVTSQLDIDRKRVFMTGFSSGAIMSYRYACEGSVRVAAIAPVAGTMMLSGCHPAHPVSVLAINGTADGEVPYAGGHLLPGASATDAIVPPITSVAALWSRLNGCSSPPSMTQNGPVTDTHWSGCAGGATVELQAITGAGHTWYAPGFGPADGAIDATQVIADFFSHLH